MGQGPGGARGVGHGHPHRQAVGPQAATQVPRHLGLPTPQVRDPGDIQEQAVRRIQRHGRGEPHAPVGELQQGRRVGLRLGLGGDQAGNQGRGVGRLLPHEQPRATPRRVHGMELAHPTLGRDQGERASLRV